MLYYRERLGGQGLAAAAVRSAVLPPDEAAMLLREPLGIEPQVLDPWERLGGGDQSRRPGDGGRARLPLEDGRVRWWLASVRTPNLATRPFSNERLPALLMGLALVGLLVLSVKHAFVLGRLLPSRTAAVEGEVRSLERELLALRAEVGVPAAGEARDLGRGRVGDDPVARRPAGLLLGPAARPARGRRSRRTSGSPRSLRT